MTHPDTSFLYNLHLQFTRDHVRASREVTEKCVMTRHASFCSPSPKNPSLPVTRSAGLLHRRRDQDCIAAALPQQPGAVLVAPIPRRLA